MIWASTPESVIHSSPWLSVSASIWTHGWKSLQNRNRKHSIALNLHNLLLKPAAGEVLKSCPPLNSFVTMSSTLLLWLFYSHFLHSTPSIFRFICLLSESTQIKSLCDKDWYSISKICGKVYIVAAFFYGFSLITQTSHLDKCLCTLKIQYFLAKI